jgi:drug/metabolite transporter (DMT)-like permease
MESVFLGNILTAFIGLPFILQSVPGSNDWLLLLILGIVQLGIPYILYSKAIKHATALESILIPVLEPLLNPVWVFLMLGEVPGPLALVGGAIVLRNHYHQVCNGSAGRRKAVVYKSNWI